MDASWLVIPMAANGPPRMDKAQVVPAGSAQEAAETFYGNAVVLGPVSVFESDATHHDDGPKARLA